MKAIALSCLLLFMLQAEKIFSQKISLSGDKVFGSHSQENTLNILKLADGYILFSSCTNAGIDGSKTELNCDTALNPSRDSWIVKMDTSLQMIWDLSLGGMKAEVSSILIQDTSGDIYFICSSFSDSSCEKTENSRGINDSDYWLGLMDSNGNVVWEKTFGGNGNEMDPQIIQLSSGDLIIGGTSTSINPGGEKTVANFGNADYWIVKTDPYGNKLWDQVYGGASTELSSYSGPYKFSLLAVDNNNFILSGSTSSLPNALISDTCRGQSDFWIVKIDSSGNKIWDHRYGGNRNELIGRILRTHDSGFIIVGTTYSDQGLDVSDTSLSGTNSDLWIVKLDSGGVKQWDKRYGGNNGDIGYWIEIAPGGGYWISGSVHSDSSSTISEHPYGNNDYWMLKIDSAGNKLFDKRFGGPGNNENPRFVILPDSSIILCGCSDTGTTSIKTQPGYGDKDIWCIHFKYEDTLSTSGVINHLSSEKFASVQPNPANQFFTVKWNLPSTENILFYLYDATGRMVLTRNSMPGEKEMNISTQDVPSGLYFWKVSCKNYCDENGKMVIMH